MNKQIYDELKNQRNMIAEKIKEVELRDKTLPEGKLIVQKCGGKYQYYLDCGQVEYEDGKKVRKRKYLRKDDMKFISELAQREYDIKALQIAKKELKSIDDFLEKVKSDTGEEYYTKLNPMRRNLIKPIIKPIWKRIEEWEQEAFVGLSTEDLRTDFYTEKGERVRSKSELLIANMLKNNGIPYRYECPLLLHKGRRVYPDFTCMNVRTGKIMYWEHLGKMDDMDYCCRNMDKITDYENAGFFPGKQLIFTHETSYAPLGTRLIMNTIENYLM